MEDQGGCFPKEGDVARRSPYGTPGRPKPEAILWYWISGRFIRVFLEESRGWMGVEELESDS